MAPLLTTKQASEFLNTSEGTLKYWRSVGTGPAFIKMESLVRYDMADLLKYKEANREVPSVRATVEALRGRL